MTQAEHNSLAFQTVLDRRLPFLRKVAYRQLGNMPDAEDAVQDALLLAHKNLARFRGDSSLLTWLVTITVNCSRMQRRVNSRFDRTGALDDLTFELRDSAQPIDVAYGNLVERQRVLDAIRELPPALRAPLMLWLEGNTIKDIAADLSRAEGTIKALLHRAKAKLRQRIEMES